MNGIVILVYGEVDVDKFGKLTKLAGKDAVLDFQLARKTGAMTVFGPKELTDRLSADLAQSETVSARLLGKHQGAVSQAAANWLVNGERGSSSNAIIGHILGITDDDDDDNKDAHPWDVDDMRRCRLLLEQVPELVPRMPMMRTVSKTWAGLVDSWGEICAVMDVESPEWRNKKGSAPGAYLMMRRVIDAAGGQS